MVGDTIKMSVPGVVCALLVSSAQAFQFKSVTGKSGVARLSFSSHAAALMFAEQVFKLPRLLGQDVIIFPAC